MTASPGARLFARYAYPPNDLGYCGPAQAGPLLDLAATGTTGADPRALARGFSGAWPYLSILAELAGFGDPLDERLVRAYWTGGPLPDGVDRAGFGRRLLETIASQAGHYWAHLTPDLLPEVSPTHGFHVLGIYPWTRLLTAGMPEHPLRVLDDCRIRWGRVTAVRPSSVTVSIRRLDWTDAGLVPGEPASEEVRTAHGGRTFVAAPAVGDWLAVHWGWACERLEPAQVDQLRDATVWQLAATNHRLLTSDR